MNKTESRRARAMCILFAHRKAVSLLKASAKNPRELKRNAPRLFAQNVRVLVLDEADSMLGQSLSVVTKIITDVRAARKKTAHTTDLQLLFFSATFKEEMRAKARALMRGDERLRYSELSVKGELRDHVSVLYLEVGGEDDNEEQQIRAKLEALHAVIEESTDRLKGQAIFFTNTKKVANAIGKYLNEEKDMECVCEPRVPPSGESHSTAAAARLFLH